MNPLIISFVLTCLGMGVVVYNDNDGNLVATRDFTSDMGVKDIDTDASNNSPTSVGVADNGNAVIVWMDPINDHIEAAVFLNTANPASTILSTTTVSMTIPQVAVNGSGQAVAVWLDDAGDLYANKFNGTMWEGETLIRSPINNLFNVQAVGIDASGRAIMVWEEGGDIRSASFNGTTVTQLGVISTGSASSDAVIAVNSSGNAVAAWVNVASGDPVIDAALFNGTLWGAPQTRSAIDTDNPRVALDVSGNAVVTWNRTAGDFFLEAASFNVSNMQWSTVKILDQSSTQFFLNQDVKINDFGEAIAVWLRDAGMGNRVVRSTQGTAALLPPRDLSGKRKTNRFPTQSEHFNRLIWKASLSEGVVSYVIFRNGVEIGTVPAKGPLVFDDHNRGKQKDTYEVHAVNEVGVLSPPATVVI